MKKRRKGNLLQRMLAVLLYAVLITGMAAGAVPAKGTTHECFVSYTIWGYDANAAFSGEPEKIEIKDSSDNIWAGTRNTVELEFSTGDNAYQIITRFTLPNGTYQLYMDEQLIEVGQGSGLTTEFTYTDSDGSGYRLYSERYFAVRFHDGDTLLNTQYILNGQTVSAPTTPVKEGYTFAGWVTEDGGSTQFDFNSGISSITDAYASWTTTKTAAESGDIPKTGGGSPDSGKVDTDREYGDNTPAADFGTSKDDLIRAVLTPKEQNLVAAGTDVKITLAIDNTDASVNQSDKQAVTGKAGGYKVGQYLDINLYKIIGADRKKVSQTNGRIRLVLTIPDSLKNKNSKMTRSYAVVRAHDGAAELLADNDNDEATVTIETDMFSTYALVYKDTEKDNEPKTGDTTPIKIYAAVAMAAGLSCLLLFFAYRKG